MSTTPETIAGYPVHAAACLYPLLSNDELAELAKDIREHGLLVPIVIHEGKILDGRNRASACELAGVQIRCTIWERFGDITPTEWVLCINGKRRHLSQSQKAAAAIGGMKLILEERKRYRIEGGTSATEDEGLKSRDIAAKAADVSPRLLQDAKKIDTEAPEKMQEIRDGKKTIHQAKKEIEAEKATKTQDADWQKALGIKPGFNYEAAEKTAIDSIREFVSRQILAHGFSSAALGRIRDQLDKQAARVAIAQGEMEQAEKETQKAA